MDLVLWIALYLGNESFPILSCFCACDVVFCLMPHSAGRMVDAKVNSIYTWVACLVWELGLSVAELGLGCFSVLPIGVLQVPSDP